MDIFADCICFELGFGVSHALIFVFFLRWLYAYLLILAILKKLYHHFQKLLWFCHTHLQCLANLICDLSMSDQVMRAVLVPRLQQTEILFLPILAQLTQSLIFVFGFVLLIAVHEFLMILQNISIIITMVLSIKKYSLWSFSNLGQFELDCSGFVEDHPSVWKQKTSFDSVSSWDFIWLFPLQVESPNWTPSVNCWNPLISLLPADPEISCIGANRQLYTLCCDFYLFIRASRLQKFEAKVILV